MNGIHIIANFYQCHYDLNQWQDLYENCIKFCTESNLHVVGKTHYCFEPCGLTFTILLAESHVSLHTWPENGNVAFDIYTCNYLHNNNDKSLSVYHRIKNLLNPTTEKVNFISRDPLTSIRNLK